MLKSGIIPLITPESLSKSVNTLEFNKCVVETNDVRAEFDLTYVLEKRKGSSLNLSNAYKGQTAISKDYLYNTYNCNKVFIMYEQ